MLIVADSMKETFCFLSNTNFDLKIVPGPVVKQRRERESVWCFFTTFVISTVAKARANTVGAGFEVFGGGGCVAMVENKRGCWGADIVLDQEVGVSEVSMYDINAVINRHH